ncbi:MAG: hypothetical protein JXA09_00005, partial [Anaerolineae bacterium]|nr:hypothetical protein [Anaerolineae bacterium]
PLTENGAVWHLKQEPGTKSAIVKASLIWPENDEGAVAFQVIAELAGADAATAPAQLTLRLALPVLGDQLAERVAGEETLDMRAHGRSWTYVAP